MDALGLLRPGASVSGLPAAHTPGAATGFALGDHAGRAQAAPAAEPGVVASTASGPLQRHFQPYQNNGGYVWAARVRARPPGPRFLLVVPLGVCALAGGIA